MKTGADMDSRAVTGLDTGNSRKPGDFTVLPGDTVFCGPGNTDGPGNFTVPPGYSRYLSGCSNLGDRDAGSDSGDRCGLVFWRLMQAWGINNTTQALCRLWCGHGLCRLRCGLELRILKNRLGPRRL